MNDQHSVCTDHYLPFFFSVQATTITGGHFNLVLLDIDYQTNYFLSVFWAGKAHYFAARLDTQVLFVYLLGCHWTDNVM